jgi:DNA gyrase/topoisomerase IV subunit A
MKAGDLRPIGRDTQGVRLMDLGEADRLVSIATLSEPEGDVSDTTDAAEEPTS